MSSDDKKQDAPDALTENTRDIDGDEDTKNANASLAMQANEETSKPQKLDDEDIKIVVTDRSKTEGQSEVEGDQRPKLDSPEPEYGSDDTSSDAASSLRADLDEALGREKIQVNDEREDAEESIHIDPDLRLSTEDRREFEQEDQAQSGELRAPVLGNLQTEQTWRAEDENLETDRGDLIADPNATVYAAQNTQKPKKGLLRRRQTNAEAPAQDNQPAKPKARKGKFGKQGFGFGRNSVRSQTVHRTAEKKKGPSVWGWMKRFYMLIGGLVFFATLCIVGFVVAFPWIEGWITNQPPSIALPSIENLRALPTEERLKLKPSAIRKAPFKEKNLASDPVPFEGGRPVELNLYRLRAVGDRVKVIGKLRHYEMPDKRQFLRLTDFEMTAGYDLRILLATANNPKTREDLEQTGFVDLAALKGEVGPQNYLLPKSLNLSDFGSMVIYDQLFEIVYVTSRLN